MQNAPFFPASIETQKINPVPLFYASGLKSIVPVIFSGFLGQIQVVFSEQKFPRDYRDVPGHIRLITSGYTKRSRF